MEHLTVKVNGVAFHVARTGAGPPLLLLHGWPEFWLSWEPVMTRLADRFTLLAPDLRGFGDSDKPDGPFGPDQHAADMLALLDTLGLRQVGIVGHDVGGALMQPLARKTPERFCESSSDGVEKLMRLASAENPVPGLEAERGRPLRRSSLRRS